MATTDDFLSHLVALLSVYTVGPATSPTPRYFGASTWQTDSILRSVSDLAKRMTTAEAALNWAPGNPAHPSKKPMSPRFPLAAPISRAAAPASIDMPHEHICPQCGTRVGGTPEIVATLPASPLVVASDGPLATAAVESGLSAVEELKLLKAQVEDVARVCNAVANGDLSVQITVEVHSVVMNKLKDAINTMARRSSYMQDANFMSVLLGRKTRSVCQGSHSCITRSRN